MASTKAATKQILMSDMFVDNEQVGKRYFKVGLSPDDARSVSIAEALLTINETNKQMLDQLKLLNARIEEAFETRIELEDVSNED
jgi:hypothetical protein